MTPKMLCGLDMGHLIKFDQHHWLHPKAATAFKSLQHNASKAGFQLTIVSSFRSFEQQLTIWNNKFTGKRPILDNNSHPLDPERLSDDEKLKAILRWSALPGASRHHWGSDLDVYDPTLLKNGEKLQLIPAEYSAGGSQAPLANWLSTHLAQHRFYRPYSTDKGGVSPEPWHISYAPISTDALTQLATINLATVLHQYNIEGQAYIDTQLEWIKKHFIFNVDSYSE